jgi:hypothetical protein
VLGASRPAIEPSPSAGGVELATQAQVAELQRQLAVQQRAIDELGHRLSDLDGRSWTTPFLTAAHSGDDPVPDGERVDNRTRVDSFDPDAD